MVFMRLESENKQETKSQLEFSLQESLRDYLNDSSVELRKRSFFILSGTNLEESLDEIKRISFDNVTCHIFDKSTDDDILSHEHNIVTFDISYRAGVTDNVALSLKELLELYKIKFEKLRYGQFFIIRSEKTDKKLSYEKIDEFFSSSFYNSLIQKSYYYPNSSERFNDERMSSFLSESVKSQFDEKGPYVSYISQTDFEDIDKLRKLSDKRHLALNTEELSFIQSHYQKEDEIKRRESRGLKSLPTEVELEILAQTWSEHCKHKIFAAEINYTEAPSNKKSKNFSGDGSLIVDSLYKQFIKNTTRDICKRNDIDWCLSVFSDNAGVVKLCDDSLSWALKVETHNSPSALDAYGGALTGILGVNRDILGCGLGFKPVANLDVFCLAPPSWPLEHERELLPRGPMTPERMLEGVHRGVQDGGNHSGIPTICGAFQFDECFAGKPLVFCGTLGVAPTDLSENRKSHGKEIHAGHKVVVVGGAVGADGIHGATFSSRELDETSPTSAVQIGDPLMQKRVLDFVLEARDLNLFAGITDNGAGGLSSSVGEMAQASGGASIDLAHCPLKYPGLSPYEIMISESQERMSLAVDNSTIDELQDLAKRRNVPLHILGEFTDTGFLDIYYRSEIVASLSIDFLHEALPQMKLKAHWDESFSYPEQANWPLKDSKDSLKLKAQSDFKMIDVLSDLSLEILSRPNIASKEKWIRRYDHEVQGASLGKPFVSDFDGNNSPRDGGAIQSKVYGGDDKAVLLSVGMAPRVSRLDTYIMAFYALDEAMRNLIAQGANPNRVSILDNFCWPDPVQSESNPFGEHRLAQLVRCCQGLREASLIYKTPLISGKDSMKNDFKGVNKKGGPLFISVDPTLLVTGLGVCDADRVPSSCFEKSGESLYLIGQNASNSERRALFLNGSEAQDFLTHEMINRLEKKGFCESRSSFLSYDWSKAIESNSSIYQKIYELIGQKAVSAIHDVSEGGCLTTLFEMGFAQQIGFNLKITEPNFFPLLYGEGIGYFIVSVDEKNRETFEQSLSRDDYLYLGSTKDNSTVMVEIKESNTTLSLDVKDAYEKWNRLNH